jgi:hypothetical protein
MSGLKLLPGRRAGNKLAVDLRLAHAAGDELAVLGAEIQDEDRLPAGFRL